MRTKRLKSWALLLVILACAEPFIQRANAAAPSWWSATVSSSVPTPNFVVDASGSTPYSTIQSALNAVTADYQVIAVMPGTYGENLTMSRFKVMLRSTNGAATTIIDAQQNGSALILGDDSIIDDFTIINSYGPAIDVEPGQDGSATNVSMVNCVLYSNLSSASCGVLYANASNLTVTNCTLFNNGVNGGSYVIETSSGTATLVNTVLWDGGDEIGVNSNISATYCDIEGATAGSNNISLNPQLTSDGHLMLGSPCIGAGTSFGAPDRDMDNEARPAADGSDDIGADQYIDSDGNGLPDWWQIQYFGELGIDPNTTDSSTLLTYLQEYTYGVVPGSTTDSNGLSYAWEMQYFGQIGLNPNTTDTSTGLTYAQECSDGVIPGATMDSNGIAYAWEMQYYGQIGLNPSTVDSSTGLTYLQEYTYGVNPGSGTMDPAYWVLPYAWEIQYFQQIGIYPYGEDYSTGLTYSQDIEYGVIPGSTMDINGLSYTWELQYFGQIGIDPTGYDWVTNLTFGLDYSYGVLPYSNTYNPSTNPDDIIPYYWEAQYGIVGGNTDNYSSTGLTYYFDYIYGLNPNAGPTDGNGLPYVWEQESFNAIGIDSTVVDPGTGLTYWQDYIYGIAPGSGIAEGIPPITPTVFFSTSITNQPVLPGTSIAVTIQVTDGNGHGLPDTPVAVEIVPAPPDGATGASTVNGAYTANLTTDPYGNVQVYYQQGTEIFNGLTSILATVGTAQAVLPINNIEVGGWQLNDGSSTQAIDSSPELNNGTLIGGPQPLYSGPFPGVLQFSGSGQYAHIPDSTSLHLGSYSFTLSGWFQSTASGQIMPIFSKQINNAGGYYGFHLGLNSLGQIEAKLGDTTGQSPLAFSTQSSFTDGQWHQFVLTIDQTNQDAILYVDGVPQSVQLDAGSVGSVAGTQVNFTGITSLDATVAQPLYLAGNPTASEFFTGQLYNLSIDKYYALSGSALDSVIDSNGIPDAWLIQYFGTTLNESADSSPDGNGLTLLQDYEQGNNPLNYYSQGGTIITPKVTITGGNNQSGPPSTFLPQALTLTVQDSTNHPLVNAPVIFTSQTGGNFSTSLGGSATPSLTVNTDSTGTAQVYYAQPGTSNTTKMIQAAAAASTVTFSETTGLNDGAVAAPSGINRTAGSADGQVVLNWTNNATNATYILVIQSIDGVNWTILAKLDPTATTFTATEANPGQYFYYFGVIAGKP